MNDQSPASPRNISRSRRRTPSFSPSIQEEGSSTMSISRRNRSISHDWNSSSNHRAQLDELTPLLLSPRRTNRTRAASHDVILNINDILPRYDNVLAERIGSITDEEVRSFAMTPNRRVRERANTCPRPRRREDVSHLVVSPLGVDMRETASWQGDNHNSPEGANANQQTNNEADSNRFEDDNDSVNEIQQSEESAPLQRQLFSSPSHSPPPYTLPATSPARRSSPTPVLDSSISPIHPPNISQPRAPCIYRHSSLLKLLMLSSLYILLSYTWKNDLQFRYKSTEINAGLAEYWNGNAKLVGDDVDDVKDLEKRNKRRPVLSHARSVDMGQRRAQRMVAEESWWSVSRMTWGLVWVGFALPVVELGWRELRRQYRLFGLRRMRIRSSSSVHDL